jgi:hypothetical protein
VADACKAQGREIFGRLIVAAKRSKAKWCCLVMCVATAILCALSHAPVLAVAHQIAAIVIGYTRFGRIAGSGEIDAIVATLRDRRATGSRHEGEGREASIRAVALPAIISLPRLSTRRKIFSVNDVVVVFRDELESVQWRTLATHLRHQPRTPPRGSNERR